VPDEVKPEEQPPEKPAASQQPEKEPEVPEPPTRGQVAAQPTPPAEQVVKPTAPPAKPTPPKPAAAHAAPPRAPAVMVTTAWESDLTKALKDRFGDAIPELVSYVGQSFLVAKPDAVVGILEFLKLEQDFDYLVDITAVHWPKRERPFDLVYVLYSFRRNERIRVKTYLADGERPQTIVGVHLAAAWLEREVFDMFGIEFAGHADLKRILLPEEWQGHPLRKEYSIIQQDERWVRENLGIDSGQ
jgi:NADH-quinone oxidoreductase subunit C